MASAEGLSPQMASGQEYMGLWGMSQYPLPIAGTDFYAVSAPDYARDIMGKLETVNSILIENVICCMDVLCCEKLRNFQVYNNDGGSKEYLFNAAQHAVPCCTDSYELIYRQGENIFGALGYTLGCCFAACCPPPICNCKHGCYCPCLHLCDPFAYLDFRFVGTMEEALSLNQGYYVSTLIQPCSLPCCTNVTYANVGGKYMVQMNMLSPFTNCCPCTPWTCGVKLSIVDTKNGNAEVGTILAKTPLCPIMNINQNYEITFPQGANSMEKLMIINSVFMYDYVSKLTRAKKNRTIDLVVS